MTALASRQISNSTRRQRAEWQGRAAEWLAVALLWLSGHRVLARRWRARVGEIDIIAVRGRRLAFVEVKYRASRDAAETAVRPRQMQRLHAAARAFVARHPGFADHEQGFDAVFVGGGLAPRLARDHLQPPVMQYNLRG